MPNALAAEKSPYLRQHADNPVDWLPWGEAAFARARAEQKPIFLSIGYSTCHWCHVMAHESFENPAIAALLNGGFVPVKLDREERPDIDRVYMTYVQQTTGHGGWPMSVWLTPELKPFFGGTYFPPDDRHGRPGFASVVRAITEHWREKRGQIEAGAEEVVRTLRRQAAGEGTSEAGGGAVPLHETAGDAFGQCAQYFSETHDPKWGGFGGAPKFPRAAVLNFLFRCAAVQGVESEPGAAVAGLAALTLQKMTEGGLHDHVGGGFHRYSVDEQWFVPHFEKMLYDQAQIAMNLLEAKQATGRETYAWVARGIFDYVRRDLTGPHGAFLSGEDADSEVPAGVCGGAPGERRHAEGAFYVWTKTELEAVLGEDAAFFCAHFGVQPGGNVVHDPQGEFTGRNILRQVQSLTMTAEEFSLGIEPASAKLLACLEKLRTVRALRPRPHLDDKVITAWNGLMISALAKGAQVLGDPELLASAARTADFLQRELHDEPTGMLYRSWCGGRGSVGGFAEDYACLIQGLLDLYEAGFDLRWLQWAEKLQGKMDALFWDAAAGGYFNSPAEDATVILRLKEDYDGAEPAANSVAVANLLRLDWMIGLSGARDRALAAIAALRPQWQRAPQALPQMLAGFELALGEPRTAVLAGDPAEAGFAALAAVLQARLGRRRVLLHADGAAGQAWLAARRPYLAEMTTLGGRAAVYLCENHTCQLPVASVPELERLLAESP